MTAVLYGRGLVMKFGQFLYIWIIKDPISLILIFIENLNRNIRGEKERDSIVNVGLGVSFFWFGSQAIIYFDWIVGDLHPDSTLDFQTQDYSMHLSGSTRHFTSPLGSRSTRAAQTRRYSRALNCIYQHSAWTREVHSGVWQTTTRLAQ